MVNLNWSWLTPPRLICVLGMILVVIDVAECLQCWHCIADNCGDDPRDNYKAIKKQCSPGQSCQKVYFEMFSTEDNRGYTSIVRGCSTNCIHQNDFTNCSKVLKTSRGCIRKNCCHDSDLCNSSGHVTYSAYVIFAIQLCLGFLYTTSTP